MLDPRKGVSGYLSDLSSCRDPFLGFLEAGKRPLPPHTHIGVGDTLVTRPREWNPHA